MQRSKKEMIFGRHPVIEALRAGTTIEKILIQKGTGGEHIKEIYEAADISETPIQVVPSEKMRQYRHQNTQGVLAFLSPIEYQNISNIVFDLFNQGKDPLILVLDGITDVRNFGAITRTAECMGVNAVLVPGRGSALLTSDAVKTSAGALFQIPICRTMDLVEQIQELKMSGLRVVTCTEKGTEFVRKADYNAPLVLIMGSEEKGISKDILKLADHQVKIPLSGSIESLNVSVATGMLLYEVSRQRTGS